MPFWYDPALQSSHSALREPKANVPARHGTGATLPVVQAWPGGQPSQPPADSRFVFFEYVPFSQGSGADAPSAQ